MPLTSIKSTYALDVSSVRALEDLAARWQVSKSEALRRAIHGASLTNEASGASLALDRLQDGLALTEDEARRWAKRARTERRATATKRARRKT
jgi:TfoX/Sxy family transcriptional regulator of competence genes